MSRIYVRFNSQCDNVYAVLTNKKIRCTELNENGDYFIDIDDQERGSIYFENDLGEKTGIVYPGALSIGVEYKQNDNMKKKLTYLFSNDLDNTGRVDKYIIHDEKNLKYRDDLSKKISVFVPSTYDGKIKYDVLYFFDAQNLFCSAGHYTENGDPYGSWQLDIVLSELHRQYGENIIVVGIDNADVYRDRELFMDPSKFGALGALATALPDETYTEGYLDELDDFIKQTLHPFIKQNYYISDEKVGIGGASMGGIASFYCGLRDLGFYKYVLSYSPAYSLYETSAYENWFSKKSFAENDEKLPKIHIYCGEGDPLERLLVGASREMKEKLVKYGYTSAKIFETFDNEKPHNEESWRLILGESFTKLLGLNSNNH